MNKEVRANVFSVKKFAVHDGPGIRTTVFFTGCLLRCPWCHNPESQGSVSVGRKDNFKTLSDLIEIVEADTAFYDESGGGVTISGGEPLVQHGFLLKFLKELKKRGVHTALDTTGYIDSGIFKTVAEYVDLFLYDLKFIDEEQHIEYTGVSNSTILENFKYLSKINRKVWVRFPMIPSYTDSVGNIRAIGSYIEGMRNIERLSVLPYHSLGSHKYEKLGKVWAMDDIKTPNDERIRAVCEIFEEYGLTVVKGG
jgi:pyruvate formate lyase activating enzyme